MTHEEIVNWLVANKPGTQWNLRSASYEGLEWLGDPSTKPTKAEMGL